LRRSADKLAIGLVVLVTLVACGNGDDEGFGKGGDASKAARTVDVRILPSKRYDPASITVTPGETVTFRVTNQDTALHEFVLGDEKVHDDHDKEMAAMPMEHMRMADRANRISMEGGQTSSLTWTFPNKKGATVIYGSHVPGDYQGGLKGTITVS
jgi:uncharacterized cupredoxin-like copper-binding protein